MGPGRIIWPKGRGSHHYVPILPPDTVVLDNYYVSSPPSGLGEPLLLAAVSNLSWTHLMCEVFGRRAGGDGILQTYIRELTQLPIPDPRGISEPESSALVEAFRAVASRQVLPLDEELRQPDRWAFVTIGMRYLFGAALAEETTVTVHRALRMLVYERQLKASVGRTIVRRARAQASFDPVPIAALARSVVGEPPDPFTGLPAAILGTITVTIPAHEPYARVETGTTMFEGYSTVLADGNQLLDAPTPNHAAMLVDLLRAAPDFAGDLSLPGDEVTAGALSADYRDNLRRWLASVDAEVQLLLPESNRSARRQAVRSALLADTGRLGLEETQ